MQHSQFSMTFRRFAVFFFPLAAAYLAVALAADSIFTDMHVSDIQARENSALLVESKLIAAELGSHISDTLILARATGFSGEQEIPTGAEETALSELYGSVAVERRVYAQVRFLSTGGMERIRFHLQDGVMVREVDDLQNKALRPYFTVALTLQPGKVYISPFDLNVEHGMVEEPFNPMVRFSSPAFDPSGRLVGVVVLNYSGSTMLDRLRALPRYKGTGLYLINQRGYFLLGPS